MPVTTSIRHAVAASLERAPIVGVVRTPSREEARHQAHQLIKAGVELIEITFTVPGAVELVRELLDGRAANPPPWIGMGTVTDAERASQAAAAGAEFLVSPNTRPEVAGLAREHALYLILGALSPSEIVQAHEAGADLVKVYPLPPVGGATYLATIRQPLDDIPMLAAGGFGIDDIPAYREAGACAFGIGAPLLAGSETETRRRVRRALALARGEEAE